MSNYIFSPSPDFITQYSAFWEKGFTDEELDSIRHIGDGLKMDEATVDGSNLLPQIRRSKTGWIAQPQCPMIYDRLAFIARRLNGQFFDFNINGFVEDMQYTVYGPEGEHYDWHVDSGPGNIAPRKLSMVLQLSDPSEYDGGDLELMYGNAPFVTKKERGLVYAFPGYMLHRVTPVTRGTRRTIVVWVAGPRFR